MILLVGPNWDTNTDSSETPSSHPGDELQIDDLIDDDDKTLRRPHIKCIKTTLGRANDIDSRGTIRRTHELDSFSNQHFKDRYTTYTNAFKNKNILPLSRYTSKGKCHWFNSYTAAHTWNRFIHKVKTDPDKITTNAFKRNNIIGRGTSKKERPHLGQLPLRQSQVRQCMLRHVEENWRGRPNWDTKVGLGAP